MEVTSLNWNLLFQLSFCVKKCIFVYINLDDIDKKYILMKGRKNMNTIIGNTPMIKINYQYLGKKRAIYTKLEYYNLTGSIKDRVAEHILNKAYESGKLLERLPIIEATSGNTDISFAALGASRKNPVIIFMPDWVSTERVNLMKSYGAIIELVSREEGGFLECIRRADELAEKLGGYRPNQFSNPDNIKVHYLTTGNEILKQMNQQVDGFVSGIGTGGTLIGIGKRLKEENSDTFIAALEPEEAPILTQGKIIKEHAIEGIGDDFVPDLVDKSIIDKIYTIHDKDAINMARLLAFKLGLGVGISSGANMLAAILCEDEIHGNIVTVFPDDNKKYLSTELVEDIDSNSEFLSNQIELLSYEVIAS